jgi:hypothetical protein
MARRRFAGSKKLAGLPSKVREKRALLWYRQGLVGRRVAVQNRLRAVLLAQGLAAPRGHRAWTQLGMDGRAQFARPLAVAGGPGA